MFVSILRQNLLRCIYNRSTILPLACENARLYTSQTPEGMTAGEKTIVSILREKFPNATDVQASDISGGCGSMYEVYVQAPDFKGKRTVMQHRMVNEALKEQIKDMHGLRITTEAANS